MVTTTTRTTAVVRTTTHDLSMHGRAGAILIILLVTLALFIVAFSTAGWSSYSWTGWKYGLWERCTTFTNSGNSSHVGTQVLMCLALVALIIATILIFLYLFASQVSKYQVLLGLVITIFIAFGLMLVAVIVFGADQKDNVSWSFAVAVITTVLSLVAGIVAAIQLSRC